jgi:hypothetical protein
MPPDPTADRILRPAQSPLGENEIVGAALLSPGFGPESSTWKLTIDRGGCLRQDIRVPSYENQRNGASRLEMVSLPAEELGAILSVAERIGFRQFQDSSTDDAVTDQETLWIAVRYPDKLKAVEAYAPIRLAALQHNADRLGFLELWARIHRFAPFPSPYEQPERLIAGEVELQIRMEEDLGIRPRSRPPDQERIWRSWWRSLWG